MAPIETYLTLALAAGVLAPCAAFITAPVATPITWMRPSGTQLSPIVAGGPAGRATAASPAALQGRAWRTTLEAGVRQVTAEQLEKEMTEWELPMILDVFATWCGPCLILKPELDKVARSVDDAPTENTYRLSGPACVWRVFGVWSASVGLALARSAETV